MPNPLDVAQMFIRPVEDRGQRLRNQLQEIQAMEGLRAIGNQRLLGEALRQNPDDPGKVAQDYLARGGDARTAIALQDRARKNELKKLDQYSRMVELLEKVPDMMASIKTQDQYDRFVPVVQEYSKALGADMPIPQFKTPEWDAEVKAALAAKKTWSDAVRLGDYLVQTDASGKVSTERFQSKPPRPTSFQERKAYLEGQVAAGLMSQEKAQDALAYPSRPPREPQPKNIDPAIMKVFTEYKTDEYGRTVSEIDKPGFERFLAYYKDNRDKFASDLATLAAFQQQEKAAAPPAAVPPPEAIAKLKEGVITTFGGGQLWTLKDGRPVRVN